MLGRQEATAKLLEIPRRAHFLHQRTPSYVFLSQSKTCSCQWQDQRCEVCLPLRKMGRRGHDMVSQSRRDRYWHACGSQCVLCKLRQGNAQHQTVRERNSVTAVESSAFASHCESCFWFIVYTLHFTVIPSLWSDQMAASIECHVL